MKDSISLKFFLNEAKAKGDLGKIYLRIYVNRIKAEISTPFNLAPGEWDENKQRARKNNLINQELSKIEHRIFTIQNILEYENRPITARILKDLYLEKDKIKMNVPNKTRHLQNRKSFLINHLSHVCWF